jgi:hypothetical protein
METGVRHAVSRERVWEFWWWSASAYPPEDFTYLEQIAVREIEETDARRRFLQTKHRTEDRERPNEDDRQP